MIDLDMAGRRGQEPIQERHGAKCATRDGARTCSCTPSYRARVRDRAGKVIYSGWKKDRGAVVSWLQEAKVAVRKGMLKAPAPTTVEQAGDELVAAMRSGVVLNRSGEEYKPSAVRSYEQILAAHIVPEIGGLRISALTRNDVQDFVEHLRGKGLAPSTVHNCLDPLRVLTRRALDRGTLLVDPFQRLTLPAVRNNRTRIEAPDRALILIEALPDGERAFWALAFFGGLRRGELRGLRCDDVDFDAEAILVRRGWDDKEGAIAAKSLSAVRRVPMSRDPLRGILRAHKLQTGRHGDDLFLGREARLPFTASTVRARALKAWETAGLRPITAHEARHCAASYMIACGWDWKKVAEAIGHSDVRTTYNRYGKLVPGDESVAVDQFDAYLKRERKGA